MKKYLVSFFILFLSSNVFAQQGISLKTTIDPVSDLREMLSKIKLVAPDTLAAGNISPQVQTSNQAVVFTTTIAVKKPAGHVFKVVTRFFRRSPTIDKDVEISQQIGKDRTVRMRMELDDKGQAFQQVLLKVQGTAVMGYDRRQDMFAYIQSGHQSGNIELKEWMYARKPNCPQGTCLNWYLKGEEFNRRVVFEDDKQGGAQIQRQLVVSGVDVWDYQKQRHIIMMVKEALKGKKIRIVGEDVIGHVQPVHYWTKEGEPKQGSMRINGRQVLEVLITERPEAYPLLIDPSLILILRDVTH